MKRTTISLPDELALLAAREAKRRGTSVSDVAREALAEHLGVAEGRPREIPFAAIGASGRRQTSRDFDKILARDWKRHIEAERG